MKEMDNWEVYYIYTKIRLQVLWVPCLMVLMTARFTVHSHAGVHMMVFPSSDFPQSEMTVPQSLFNKFCFSSSIIKNASFIRRMSTFLCFSAQACSALNYFCVSPPLMEDWYSFTHVLVHSALLVSPMHSFPQLQRTLYTTPTFIRGGLTSLIVVSCCLSVGIVVNTVLM